MSLLVTGGAGFIGSNFVRYWLSRHPGEAVVVYDALSYAGNRASLADVEHSIVFVHADICDLGAARQAISENGVEVVVHFAAESHNSLAVTEPGRFFVTNVIGTQTMCEAARHEGVRRFHHISTCEVYGDLALDSPARFTESSPYRPRTPYNASKAGADHTVRAYSQTYGLPITITNCCNNYGPFQFPEKLVALFSVLALDNKSLPMYQSTQNRREWLHVDDHCRAVEMVIESGRVGETYHVGSGVEASISDIAEAILAASGRPSSLKMLVPDRPGHDRRYLLDSTKIRTELGWEPQVGFEEGLAATVAWYAGNRDWWEPLMGRSPVNEGAWPQGAGAGASG